MLTMKLRESGWVEMAAKMGTSLGSPRASSPQALGEQNSCGRWQWLEKGQGRAKRDGRVMTMGCLYREEGIHSTNTEKKQLNTLMTAPTHPQSSSTKAGDYPARLVRCPSEERCAW